ncbi:MAG: GNAT family N-acetyltransferase [Hyphomicrobiales bacterium]|nr:GNAT family N-acetyltransferase [Hyphomicrobiales bacterium]
MSIRHLHKLFKPSSVAVVGASNRAGTVGNLVMRNLLQGGFSGPIMPVNPKYTSVAGVLTYPDVASLAQVPDMAVICTPPKVVPQIVEQLVALGTTAAITITAGMTREETGEGRTAADDMMDAARHGGMRILGPNCLGLLVPGIGLNASFSHLPADPGRIAFVSQSGALCTAVLDWARTHEIGFSHFVSLGDGLDVDFGDVIDYLGSDPGTRAILLYIESIRERRNFMSAARAAARNKPIVVIKSGRVAEGARAAASHTGALAGADDVFDAAIRRAGMLRVNRVDELFAAVETLARSRPPRGDRLAILTNGGGIGVMAVDELVTQGGHLARLSDDVMEKLNAVLPPTWSHNNPIDIIGDAPGERYTQAVEILSAAKEVDALLVMHAPTATASATGTAEAVIGAAGKSPGRLLTSWVGGDTVMPARRMFSDAGIPTFETPEQAVGAFMHMVNYRRNQETLMETPPSAPAEFTPATATARLIIEGTLASGHDMVSEPEAKAVLAAYGIPTVETHIATTPEEAADKAAEMGFPVALKILSPNISHKSDMGGVDLFLDSRPSVISAAENMVATIKKAAPHADLQGFSVQRMAQRPGAHELIVGIATDPIFGPVILFGQGGTAVEVIGDRAVALPPLNMSLARDLVRRTRVARLLHGYRDRPPIDLDALSLTLLQVSQLAVDIPEIAELDINPLFADENGVLALDARIRLQHPPPQSERLAIRPYPRELEEPFTLRSGRKVLLRPIRPEDEPNHYEFLSKLTPEDIRFRFFGLVGELPHTEMARLTQIDYDREMAFIATAETPGGTDETLGVVRTVTDPDNERAEYAIVVRSDLKGQKLGWKMLDKMVRYCRQRGTKQVVGQVLRENRRMLDLVKSMGFKTRNLISEPVVEVTLTL